MLSLVVCFVTTEAAGKRSSSTDGAFVKNPMLWADVPDPDIIRVGDTFYLVTTTMHLMPGAPIMQSKDFLNWETVGYVFDKLTDSPKYDFQEAALLTDEEISDILEKIPALVEWANSIQEYAQDTIRGNGSVLRSRARDQLLRRRREWRRRLDRHGADREPCRHDRPEEDP